MLCVPVPRKPGAGVAIVKVAVPFDTAPVVPNVFDVVLSVNVTVPPFTVENAPAVSVTVAVSEKPWPKVTGLGEMFETTTDVVAVMVCETELVEVAELKVASP